MLDKKIILGIDPGTNVMGYGIISCVDRQINVLDVGAHRIKTVHEHIDKLHEIYKEVNRLITRFHPDEMAIESPFFGKNVQSMHKLGRAQGVAIAACLNAGLRVYEYAPKKIKKAVTGNGNASKEQVAALLPHLATMPKMKLSHDASDALATAICHHLQQGSLGDKKQYKDWSSYAQQHSHRVR